MSNSAPNPGEKKTFPLSQEGGIINYLRALNSVISVKCTSSGQGSGAADDFITFSKVSCWTTNQPFSWFCVDLGTGRRAKITHYSLRYSSPGNACCPREWILQGSNNPPNGPFNAKDTNWVTISTHKGDTSLNSAYASKTWQVAVPKVSDPSFRYFRIVQIGKNAYAPQKGARDEWSNVLVAGGYEIWGDLSEGVPEPQNAVPVSIEHFFPFKSTTERNGIINSLKDRYKINITCSNLTKGKLTDFIEAKNCFIWTKNERFSWFSVDFGEDLLVTPTHYTLRYASTASYCSPRNWLFQGSNVPDPLPGPPATDPADDPNWVTLSWHVNDTTLSGDYAQHTWPVTCNQAFRFLRVIQIGKNNYTPPKDSSHDEWSHVFVVGGFEVYGYTNRKQNTVPNKMCNYQYDLDGFGVVAYLQQFGIRPTVTCSSVGRGLAPNFLSRQQVNCWTKNEKFSWFALDFGDEIRVAPSQYTLGYSSGGNACCPRYWVLQASHNPNAGPKNLVDPAKDPNWVTLCAHNNDHSLNAAHATKTWSIPGYAPSVHYRYFRVLQTGKNNYVNNAKGTDEWSDCLVAGKFELYGYVLSTKNPDVPPPVVPAPLAPVVPVSPVSPVSPVMPNPPTAIGSGLTNPNPSNSNPNPSTISNNNNDEQLAGTAISSECTVCYTNPKNALLLSCGHLSMCYDCATKVFNTSGICPICRLKIDRIIKAFIT